MLPKIDQLVNFSSGSKEKTTRLLVPAKESIRQFKNRSVARIY
jgi:hypothetical protein